MDRKLPTGAPEYTGEGREAVSSYVTSFVLLVGVFGGLFLVVVVIIICKYCQRKNKSGRNYSGRDSLSERTFRALQRLETINSDIFTDPSTCSGEVAPLTPRKPTEFRIPQRVSDLEEATETTQLKADFEKDEYTTENEIPLVNMDTQEESGSRTGTKTSPTHAQNTSGALPGSRRVSFQLDNLPRSSSSGDFKVRRYIEGDFHHLKHTKIGRPLPRQFSMGGAGSAVPKRMLLDSSQIRFSSLDERMSTLNAAAAEMWPDVQLHLQQEQRNSLQHLHTSQNHNQHQENTPQQQHGQQEHQVHQPHHHHQQQQQPEHHHQQHHPQQPPQPHSYQQPGASSIRDSRRSSKDREPSPRAFIEHRRSSRETSPRESSSFGAYKPPRGIKNSPSPTLSQIRDKEMNKKSPSPPFKSIREESRLSPQTLVPSEAPSRDSPPSPFRPIKDFISGSSPSPPYRFTRTQVSVEIHSQHIHAAAEAGSQSGNSSEEQHQQLFGRLERARSQIEPSRLKNVPNLARTKHQTKTTYSHSLEAPSTSSRAESYKDSRKVKSYEDFLEDYDVLKITEFTKGPFYNTDYDVVSDLGSPTGAKVRYNDTGSLEQLNEERPELLCDPIDGGLRVGPERRDPDQSEDTEDSVETLNGNRKYRALWRLRATLEEEEECSDTIRMEDMTSPDDSPDREHVTPNTTSFESNAPSDACPSDHRDSGIQFESCSSSSRPRNNQANLLHPNYENRRQNYRNVLNNRFQRGNQSTSVENSFDSVETDGEVSDTSRYEVTTTSFESTTTTDNTDSTTESQASKLRQMKADSGYKSLEAQQQHSKEMHDAAGSQQASREIVDSELHQNQAYDDEVMAVNDGSGASGHHVSRDRRSSGATVSNQKNGSARKSPPQPNNSHFERRTCKTASKKRREYSRERQTVHVHESINEPEPDYKSDLHSGDSFEDSSIPNKISVFARFFKSHPRGHRTQYLARDYSIDEKTNSIFNDFVRQEFPKGSQRDAADASGGRFGVRRSPRMHRARLHRKHTEPSALTDQRSARRDRLAPTMRSASLGSDSSASSARRISPQDSIEEEEYEVDDGMAPLERVAAWPMAGTSSGAANHFSSFGAAKARSPELAFVQRHLQTVAIHEIPIIRLPEEDTTQNTS